MLDENQMRERQQSAVMTAYIWFLRAMAVVCLVSGLLYWAQLTGISSEGTMRFDLLDVRWRVILTILAVVLPSAALGLWMEQPWGMVLWIIAIGMEISAFGFWAHLYEARPMLVAFHAMALAVFVLLAAAAYFERRRRRLSGY